ncbi:MAG: hypothetical protein ACMV1C_07610, partial [Bacteroides graminisolvens]
ISQTLQALYQHFKKTLCLSCKAGAKVEAFAIQSKKIILFFLRRKEKQGQDGLFNSSSEKNPKKKERLTLVGRLANHRWATG